MIRCKVDSMTESVTDVIQVTAESMGYPKLQETAFQAFVTGRDAFVSIPTGGGRSLCYLVLPNMFEILWGRGNPQFLASTHSWDAVLRVGDTMLRDEM